MGRLGPLTSMALGRSPYDDVVEGTGEDDPREPRRQYDEKGRIINPESKQRIKDVIRAHNEVMEVIGVAEPDSHAESNEMLMVRDHQLYETETGNTLLNIGRSLGIFGIWGVHGVRQRIMLYKSYSDIEFLQLMHYEREQRSLSQLLLTGLPPFLVMQGIHWTRLSVDWVLDRRWARFGLSWCQFHLHLFLTMQRLGLISGSGWFPGWKFFIPFTDVSPIPAPPPMEVLSVAAAGSWINRLVMNVAPYAAFFLCGRIWNFVHINIWPRIHAQLPRPALYDCMPRPSIEPRTPVPDDGWQTAPESPTLGGVDREIRHGGNPEWDPRTLQVLEGDETVGADNGIALGAVRRQSTFSSRGGEQDYGTDEEDADMVNPTLISFDVDTSDSNEQPAGVWSAELRPSFGGEGGQQPIKQPIYTVNPLTSLPAVLATDILTNFVTYTICAPFDAAAIRATARAFARRRGLSTAAMYQVSLLDGLCWRTVGNILALEVTRLMISGELWAATSIISQWLHVTEEEWKDFQLEEDERNIRELQSIALADTEAS